MSLGRAWTGSLELSVRLDDGELVGALAYPALVGSPEVGECVLLNISALARGLGTGGFALVVARPKNLPEDPIPGPGHLVKARYTPLQTLVLGVDEEESPHHETLRAADDLTGMPVVTADLHSALPAIISGVRAAAASAGQAPPRIAYVMTDGGALPAWFSRTVAELRESDWLTACITSGQAFGGDLEAVSVHSALLAARHVVGADITIVAQGPGNLGTGTRWGFSGVTTGETLNAAAVLGGRPIGSVRVSALDARTRHVGISHHSRTAYGRVALARADIVLPLFTDPALGWLNELIASQAAEVSGQERHALVTLPAGDEQIPALRDSPSRMSTMGRELDVDPTPFLAAAVAGEHAFGLLTPEA